MKTICEFCEIGKTGAREFCYVEEGQERRGFLVKHKNRLFAYQNACPHTGVTLNWMPDTFLDVDKRHIVCTVHGALFRIQDGYCIRGPCAGDSLRRLTTDVDKGRVFLAANHRTP